MIWCVEDDAAIREIEIYALESTGFQARGFSDGDSFWQAIQKEQPELVVLDVMLPGTDGVELLRRIRSSKELQHLPVIMATAKGSEYDKIQSLDLGADDYVVKPFGVMELISRIRAVLRRTNPVKPVQVLQMGSLVLNTEEHTVAIDGERVALTFKEYELLRLFMSHPGVAYTRDQLLAQVWEMDYMGETRTVDMHIRTLRQKLGNYGKCIETVRHVGYRMEKKH